MYATVYDPTAFLIEKMMENDVVLLGGNHSRPFVLEWISEILPALSDLGMTHLGLEIATDQQPAMDRFMASGNGLEEVDIFHVIDRPEYRSLLKTSQKSALLPLALDLPRSLWNNGKRRDQWMAGAIGDLFAENPRAKMLAILGNLHVLKTVEWLNPLNTGRFLPSYLNETHPGLRVYSIVTEHADPELPSNPPFYGAERACAVDAAHIRHEISILSLLAARKRDACHITDGLIFCR